MSGNLSKNDIVSAIAQKSGLTKSDSVRALDAFIEVTTESLKKGSKVSLVGFGTFEVVKRSASEGRNPRTGESIKIPAHNQPKFRAGKNLKESVR